MESGTSDWTPHIPGIDTVELLERIGEDPDLFWDILGEFSLAYRGYPAQIAAALNRDPAEAKRLAHTLKGVLGNLGAIQLFVASKGLDEAIRESREELYPEHLATLERDLPILCDAIDHARTARGAHAAMASPQPSSAWLETRYAALESALESHRARDCKTIADEIAATALPADERAFFDALHPLVRAYRFKDAQAMLARRSHAL